MKVTLKGLKQYVDFNCSLKELEEAFINIGFEIEEIIEKGITPQEFIVVGKILSFEKHPNADRLNVCQVDVGDGNIRQIVCGAKNFKQNDVVPVALPGAILPGEFKIKKSNLRGIKSEGMMCSGRELGLGDDHSGLLILDPSIPLGTKIHELFPDKEVIINFEITANRGDALSVYGISRELAAYFNLPLKDFPKNVFDTTNVIKNNKLNVLLESNKCETYTAIKISGVRVTESPDWIKNALSSVGIATINNIVDITNWIMLQYGQPLHAFDVKKLTSEKIIIREAQSEEKILALDGNEYVLNEDDLVVADEHSPIAIAGIIGGENSKIDDQTTDIILEGACFDHSSIRKTSRKLQINTDSAYRFSRHVDGYQTQNLLLHAANMITEIAGGQIVDFDTKTNTISCGQKHISLDGNFVRKILGFNISNEEIANILTRLQYVVQTNNVVFDVISPSYRWDVTRPIDLVEEIIRIYGVKNIPNSNSKFAPSITSDAAIYTKSRKIADLLSAKGFHECYNYTLVDDAFGELPIDNPLIEGQTAFRSTLVYGLIESLKRNVQNDNGQLKLFEIGHIAKKFNNNFKELFSVAFVIPQTTEFNTWHNVNTDDIFVAKHILKEIYAIVSNDLWPKDSYEEYDNLYFLGKNFSARWGDLLSNDKCESRLGYLKPEFCEDIDCHVIAGEIFLEIEHINNNQSEKTFKKFTNFPSAKRDISIIINRDLPGEHALNIVRENINSIKNPAFTDYNINVFDIYDGENLSSDKKSLAVRIAFKNKENTMSDKEIDETFSKLVTSLKSDTRIEFRG